jgi:hypothetical protein
MIWSWSLALAVEPPPTVSQVVQADAVTVQTVIADLARWPGIWGLSAADDASRIHVRGEPLTVRQLLVWSAGEQARGRMTLDAISSDSVDYSIGWMHGLLPTRTNPPGHKGHIELLPEGGGTRVSWTVDIGEKRRSGPVMKRVERAMDALATAAEQGAPSIREPQTIQPVDAVVAWQGFTHQWTYNHRINRSGDWWTPPECSDEGCVATQTHASASGSGIDRATFSGFGSMLRAPGVTGWYGSASLWFDGKEGEELTDRVCVPIPEEAEAGPALLLGYDLDAVESADSLWAFAVSVEREGAEVCSDARIRMDCKTPECGSERLTTYTLTVPFVVVAGPVETVEAQAIQEHNWKAGDIRDEPRASDHPVGLSIPVNADRPALVGISGFSVELDAALHTLGLDLAVRPGELQDAELPVDLDLFYLQWGPVEIAPMTVAQFAHEGRARITADLVVVQPETGCIEPAHTTGTTFWPGKQADASVPLAEHRSDLRFSLDCSALE